MTRRHAIAMILAAVAGFGLSGHAAAKTKSRGKLRKPSGDRKATPYRNGHSTSPKFKKR